MQHYDFYDYLFFASKANSFLPWFTDPDHTHAEKSRNVNRKQLQEYVFYAYVLRILYVTRHEQSNFWDSLRGKENK